MYFSLHLRWVGAAAVAALTISHALVSAAPSQCEQVLSRFGDKLIDATCADSADLTTANLATTPANNAIATLPPFAFTPHADRDTIAPPAILNYPAYAASGFDPDSKAAKNIRAAGYPPDLITTQGDPPTSLWRVHYLQFWEVTMCQWQKRLDPAYDTYGAGLGNYVYVNRLSLSN